MEDLNITYFRNLLSKNVDNLQNLCKEWETVLTDSSVPEDVQDEIRTTIGLTNLLLRQKLKQFHGLIDDSEFKRGEKEITCLDLQGFWDMVYSEVEKIHKSFQKLKTCKENDWKFVEEPICKVETKKKQFSTIAKITVSSNKYISAARQRLAEAKLKMKAQMASNKSTEPELNGNVGISSKESIKNKEKDEVSVTNTAISNITNMQISQEKQLEKNSKTPLSKTKGHIKNVENLDKENVSTPLSTVSDNIPAHGCKGRRKAKEVIPLQCVTRSAKKAMLIKQTGS